jgi:hypothetical protein
MFLSIWIPIADHPIALRGARRSAIAIPFHGASD